MRKNVSVKSTLEFLEKDYKSCSELRDYNNNHNKEKKKKARRWQKQEKKATVPSV